ncbi:MAG: hypothetical protein GY827_11545 [Cytophagales bacterium]|nr:hypothetical protein [Cytophagales bacterium]
MMKDLKIISGAILLVSMLLSCERPPDYSLTPEISFKDIQKEVVIGSLSLTKQDSVTITLRFQDGDGDLGMNTEEVGTEPYIDFYERNYHATLFKKVQGVFEEVKDEDDNSIEYGGVFPRLIEEEGPIDGDLNYHILISHNNAQILEAFDTLRFEVFIIDRELNQSNTVTTGEFIYKNE